MLGYTAKYVSGEIDTTEDELENTKWCHPDEMPTTLAGNISISQWLLNDFLERHRS